VKGEGTQVEPTASLSICARGKANYMINNVQSTDRSHSGQLACNCDKWDFALLTIAVVGLVIASIGLAIQQGWLPAGSLSSLNQGAIAMIVVGGGVALLSLVILSVKKLRAPPSQPVEEQPNQANSPVASTQNFSNASNRVPTATNSQRTNEQTTSRPQPVVEQPSQAQSPVASTQNFSNASNRVPTATNPKRTSEQTTSRPQPVEEQPNQAHSPIVANTRNNASQEPFATLERGLQKWVDEAPTAEEKRDRSIAQKLIRANFQEKGSGLSLFGLTTLPSEIGKLTHLTTLYLNGCKLTSLPAEFEKLTNLTILDLRDNQLKALPPEIEKVTSLIHLDLSNNQLTALPPGIEKLTNLIKLFLENNRLTAFPLEIGKLRNLRDLNLKNNHLTVLPRSIQNLPNNLQINLEGNPFSSQVSNDSSEITLKEYWKEYLEKARASKRFEGPKLFPIER
jgi:hypothetical protein